MSKKKLSNKKIKVLVYADSPSCATGFGTVTRNICEALYKTGRYELEIFGINYWGDPTSFPYKIWPAGTNNQKDPYGRQKFTDMAPHMEFDILFCLQDTFILEFMPSLLAKLKESGKTFKSICYFPIDGKPKENWIRTVDSADKLIAYSEYGKKQSKDVYSDVQDIQIITHGANVIDFKPLPEEEVINFKKMYFGKHADKFIVVNLNRNQHRKDIPRTIAAFKEFRKEVPESILYLHMAAKDQGWDLVEVCKTYGFNNTDDVIFPENFGPNQGYPLPVVNMIYNAADLTVSTTIGEGMGLCLHPKTNIYTEHGIKYIEDITVKDKVLSSDGTFNNVEAVMSKDHDGDLYNITTWMSNIPVKSSPDHGFLIFENGKCIWKKASELVVGDTLVFPKNEVDYAKEKYIDIFETIEENLNVRQLSNIEESIDGFRIQSNFKATENYIPKKIKITESLMYLFGLYLAEGSINSAKKDAVIFSFHKNETDLMSFVKKEMKLVFGLDAHSKDDSKRVGYNGASIVFYSSVVSTLFYTLFGSGARNKKIPSILLNQSKDKLKEFVYGEFVGDGHYSNTNYEFSFSTTSKHIAYGLRYILAKLGVLSSVRTSRVEYKVTVSGTSKRKLLDIFGMYYDSDRKWNNGYDRASQNDDFLLLPIKDLKVSKYKGKLIDIQVANTNDFVAENVVVHNSWLESMATKTPVLMPNNTAMTEFITEERGYLCDSGTTPSLHTVLPNDNEVVRPLVDIEDMAKKMVHIYKNYDEAIVKAENAYEWIKSDMNWQGNIGKEWVKLFDETYKEMMEEKVSKVSNSSINKIIDSESL